VRFNLIIAAALLSLGILPAPARDEKPDKKFLQETIAAAENGDPAAQCALGACFESGAGMLKDLDQAAKWYRRAAAQGDAMAECALASCYERGQGVKKDLAEAAKFYTQAAEQGYMPRAQALPRTLRRLTNGTSPPRRKAMRRPAKPCGSWRRV